MHRLLFWFCACIALFSLIDNCRAGTSLSDLNDDPLRIELANDGLGPLLDRAFVVDNVATDARRPEMAVLALRQLADPNLSSAQQSRLVQTVVAGISDALPKLNDPQILLSGAAVLVKQGVEREVNVLEYFGEDGSAADKARLRPVVGAAVAMYDRALAILDQQQTELQNQIQAMDDPATVQWQKVYKDFQTASYTRWMLSYSYAISLDADDPKRAAACEDAIAKLDQWDNADSGVQALVRLQEGKLLMSENRLAVAKQKLLSVFVKLDDVDETKPPPDAYTEFNARYFYAACDVLAGDAATASDDAKQAEDFRNGALPGVVGDQYAMQMLQYRIDLLNHQDDAAQKILEDLSSQAPGLRTVIAAHLLDRMPPNPDVNQLSPLLLTALIEKAWTAASQPTPDPALLNEGLAAAVRYLQLADQADPDTTHEGAIEASESRGVILKALGQPEQAAAAFLDHAQRYTDDVDAHAPEALNESLLLVGQMYRSESDPSHQSDLGALEDRLLPLAVDAFHRYDLAYEYARHLQRQGHPAHAAEVFDLVPPDDPNADNAVFFKMVALNQRLDADPRDLENAVGPAELPKVTQEIQQLADQFDTIAAKKESESKDPAAVQQFQSMSARTTLLAADVASRAGNDPRRSLQLLANFEQSIQGLPDSQSLLAEALNLRVAAYMAAGDANRAAQTLIQYLNTTGGNDGLQTVYDLLTTLNRQFDAAEAKGDSRHMRQLAEDRAALTPFLVEWAKSNPNPDIFRYTYRYEVFDAATQAQAAEQESNSDLRQKKLETALAKYRQLQSPDEFKLYQASLPADAGDDERNSPDPQVALGIGDVAFALGDWKTAHDAIGELLASSKLGDGTITIRNSAGQDEIVDNNQFWEAQYKFIYSTMELARDPASGVDATTPRTMLRRLAAVWQTQLGGAKWHGKFMALQKEIG